MKKLHGREAIEYAEATGAVLHHYTTPIEDATDGISQEKAREIAREDPSLVWCEAAERDSNELRMYVPPQNQGQMIEVSYGYDWDAGILYRRTMDRSSRAEEWSCVDIATVPTDEWAGPWNEDPPVADDAWESCEAPE